MVTRVETEPLRVEFSFPNGTQWTGKLDTCSNPALAEGLARGLVELVHPLGDVKHKRTAVGLLVSLRRMVEELAESGFHGGVGDLRKSHMLTYWLGSTAWRVQRTRRLLQGCGMNVDADLRIYLAGNTVKAIPRTKPLEPYDEDQWLRIESFLRERLQQAARDQREVMDLAGLGPDPSDQGLNRQNLAWLLAERGPIGLDVVAEVLGVPYGRFQPSRGGVGPMFLQVRSMMFPSVELAMAARLLFGVYCGVVPDGIRDLGLEDFTWTGDRTAIMEYMKGRRALESVNLPARAIRLFERWCELSTHLRTFAPDAVADDLWIFHDPHRAGAAPGQRAVLSFAVQQGSGGKSRRALGRQMGLVDEAGKSVPLHTARIRTTYTNMLARSGWSGRTRIDPNHSRAVEGGHYVSTTTPAQTESVETVIEDAQADILRRRRPALVLTDEEAALAAATYPDEIARLGLDGDELAALLGSEMDVFTAACANQMSGLHGPKGKPCPARPWVCVLCPLAVFMPRHAPNLLRLKAYFARQSRQMTVDQFLAVFGPYADRLSHDILPRFEARVLEAAAGQVGDDDSELPLRPEEVTQ
ncbi:hypothetical protein [Streptacidiphilus sp. EB103A]|uniref:hypothetical protein n=1 Tax=Streptacidiphilus sp. EB103A TaxID=3156275 RepID=UPI0035199276